MLDHDESRRLETLAEQIQRDDPRFAEAMHRGVPRAPHEYRLRRQRIPAVAAVVAVIPMVLGYPLVGFLAAWVYAAVAILWYSSALDRPTRHRRPG